MSSESRRTSVFHADDRQSNFGPTCASDADRHDRIFPAPWGVDQIAQGYRVMDGKRRVLAYVVAGDQGTNDQSVGLTLEEAGRIARVISSLPDLILKAPTARSKKSFSTSIRRSA